jgi:hypothetical protein
MSYKPLLARFVVANNSESLESTATALAGDAELTVLVDGLAIVDTSLAGPEGLTEHRFLDDATPAHPAPMWLRKTRADVKFIRAFPGLQAAGLES